MQDYLRAFIAVEINDAIRAELADIQSVLEEANGHVSWVRPQNIHCTLVFLGDILTDTVDPVAAVLKQVTAGCKPFEVEIAGLGYFGSARSPRIIWAGMAGRTDALIELQGKINAAVLQAGLKPDEKLFKPHLTIGRVRSNRNAAALVRTLVKNRDKSFGAFAVKVVVLMKSVLEPTGPIYSLLHAFAFA